MAGPPVLVTGGAGYVGTRVLDALARLAPGREIRVLDPVAPAASGVRHVAGRTENEGALREAAAGVGAAIHLSALTTHAGELRPLEAWDVNVAGLLRLVGALANAGARPRLVLASSLAAMAADGPAGQPGSTYGAGKRAAEMLLLDATRHGLVDGVVLRLPPVIVRPSRTSRGVGGFVSDLVRSVAAGEPYACPVPLDHRSPVASGAATGAALAALALAPDLPAGPGRLLEMPSLAVTPRGVIAALERAGHAEAPRLVEERIDAQVLRICSAWPARLGTPGLAPLVQPDPSIDAALAPYLDAVAADAGRQVEAARRR